MPMVDRKANKQVNRERNMKMGSPDCFPNNTYFLICSFIFRFLDIMMLITDFLLKVFRTSFLRCITCQYEGQRLKSGIFRSYLPPYFLRHGLLSLAGPGTTQGLGARRSGELSVCHFPSTREATEVCHHTQIFTQVLRIQTQHLVVVWKALYCLRHLPIPRN